MDLRLFGYVRQGGIIAMGIDEGDAVIDAQLSDGASQVFLGTRDGMSIRFEERDVRPMGRTAYGVRGITLRDGDEVVAMAVARPGATMATVTENGYGKRTNLDEYRVQSRGGVGIINIQTSERNGRVAGMACVTDEDELMIVTQAGKVLRMAVEDMRAIGRNAQGVRLIGIEEGDRVVSVARLAEKDEDNGDGEKVQDEDPGGAGAPVA
jgi:DNA gyrase subunit A